MDGNWCDEVIQVDLDFRGHRRDEIDFAVVTVVFGVVFAEEKAIVRVVRGGMNGTRLDTCASMQMQTHQSRQNERQDDHPE